LQAALLQRLIIFFHVRQSCSLSLEVDLEYVIAALRLRPFPDPNKKGISKDAHVSVLGI
jgi:hypothetical protein